MTEGVREGLRDLKTLIGHKKSLLDLKHDWKSMASAPNYDTDRWYWDFMTNQMAGDIIFKMPILSDAEKYTAAGVKTYVYYFGELNE